MFRITRPLAQVLKRTTGLTGLAVHPNPLPELTKTYESTLAVLTSIPQSSVYRQGVEALTHRKLKITQAANGDISAAEKELDEGQIEESLDIASDELKLAAKMVDWKASVFCVCPLRTLSLMLLQHRWEPLEDKPEPGQWEYLGQSTSS